MFKIVLNQYESVCDFLDIKDIKNCIDIKDKFVEFYGFKNEQTEIDAEEMIYQNLGDIVFYKKKKSKSLKEYLQK